MAFLKENCLDSTTHRDSDLVTRFGHTASRQRETKRLSRTVSIMKSGILWWSILVVDNILFSDFMMVHSGGWQHFIQGSIVMHQYTAGKAILYNSAFVNTTRWKICPPKMFLNCLCWENLCNDWKISVKADFFRLCFVLLEEGNELARLIPPQ